MSCYILEEHTESVSVAIKRLALKLNYICICLGQLQTTLSSYKHQMFWTLKLEIPSCSLGCDLV